MPVTLTIAAALRQATRLTAVSDSPRLDAELLLMAAGHFERTYLYTWPERALTHTVAEHFEQMLARRAQGEPVAHITGQREFWSLPLQVNNTTLIPRPDTEVLVEVALASIQALAIKANGSHALRVLDLGTGTGAVALALACELPKATVLAIDNSAAAVTLAQHNAARCGHAITVEQGDWHDAAWLHALSQQPLFDCIVSNPPYIDASDVHLNQGDVRFEPLSALVAPDHGYADLARIIAVAFQRLTPGGAVWLEHGYQQASRVQSMLVAAGFTQVVSHNDYGGNPRVTGGIRPNDDCRTGL